MCDEITYSFPNFNSAAVEVWEVISNFISSMLRFNKKNIQMCKPSVFHFQNDTLYDDEAAQNIRKTYMRKKVPPLDHRRNGTRNGVSQRKSSGLSSRSINVVAPL